MKPTHIYSFLWLCFLLWYLNHIFRISFQANWKCGPHIWNIQPEICNILWSQIRFEECHPRLGAIWWSVCPLHTWAYLASTILEAWRGHDDVVMLFTNLIDHKIIHEVNNHLKCECLGLIGEIHIYFLLCQLIYLFSMEFALGVNISW